MHAPIPILIVSDRFRDCNRGTCETKAPLSNRTQGPFAPSGTAHLHLYTAGVRRSEWKLKIRFTFRPDFVIITPAEYAPVAQLDRVTDSDSVGQRFESARAYHKKPAVRQVFLLCAADSRFIPERGNPLGRTTKKPAVRQVFLLCAADSRFIPGRGNPLGRTTKKPCSFNGYRVFLRRCSCKKSGAIQAAFGYKMPCDAAPKTNLPQFGNVPVSGFCGIGRIKVQPAAAKTAAPSRLSKRHIQRHHHAETDSEENGSEVGVLSLRHFGDQLLHHNIEHGTGCKA